MGSLAVETAATAQARAGKTTVMIYTMGEVIGDGVIKLPFAAAVREAFPDLRDRLVRGQGLDGLHRPLKTVAHGLIDEVLMTGRMGVRVSDHLFRPFDGRRVVLVIDTQGNFSRGLYARRATRRVVARVAGGTGRTRPAARGGPAPIGMLTDRPTCWRSPGGGFRHAPWL